MSGEFPGLGFDPAPGNLGSVESLATDLATTAQHLGDAYNLLSGIGHTSGLWQGKAADAASEQLGKLPEYLRNGNLSLSKASATMKSWATQLESFQDLAKRYETQAEELRDQLRSAQSDVDAARQNPDLKLAGTTYATPQQAQAAQTKLNSATTALDDKISKLNEVTNELDHLVNQAKQLLSEHDSVARDLATKLKDATKGYAPPEPSLWDRIAGALSDIGHAIGDALTWIKNNAGNILQIASAVCGIIAIFCPIFAPIAIGLSLAAFVVQASEYGVSGLWPPSWSKAGNYLNLAGDLIGAVPGVGALFKGGDAALDVLKGADSLGDVADAGKLFGTRVVENLVEHQGGDAAINPLISKGAEWTTTALHLSADASDVAKWTQVGVASTLTGMSAASDFFTSGTTSTVLNDASDVPSDGLGLYGLLDGFGVISKG